MVKSKTPLGKLLWAFNPFHDKPSALQSSVQALLRYSKQSGMKPEPVYVVSPAEVNVVLEFSIPAKERYRQVSLARSRKVLKDLEAESLEPVILIEKSLSLSASTKLLVNYAQSQEAEAILAGTASGKGLRGALLGSFAETLLYQARCPVVLIHPGAKIGKRVNRLLFISDLSPTSLEAFDDFCRWAAGLGAEVRLFHSIPRPFSWASFAVDALLGPDRMSEKQYLILTRKLRENDVKPFREMAQRFGLRFSHQLDIGGKEVSDDALKAAKKYRADLIGLAGRSGPLKTRILGSVTKSLLRSTQLPIWIKHS
ncbi:MAG TPA: universal stress protein [bacterium]|nr:universal stress protein [bacterium]